MVYNQTIESLSIATDIVYLDPPYNNRQYSSNYCPLNYIARYDDTIHTRGKTGLLENYNKSKFSIKKDAVDTFIKLIDGILSSYIFVSYNEEGIIPFQEMKRIFLKKGDVKLYKIRYKKYKSSTKQKDENIFEFIWYIDARTRSDLHTFDEIIIN